MKVTTLLLATLTFSALAALRHTAIAAPGDLDLTFGGTGKVTTTIVSGGSSTQCAAQCVAVQTDGKIIVAGDSYITTHNFALVRYNVDGSLDTGFNGTGTVTTSFGTSNAYGNSVALQSDGKIVVAGSLLSATGQDFVILRYNANGSLDTSFNGTGEVITDLGSNYDNGHSVALQSDGKIVVAGSTIVGTADDFAMVRYNVDGSLDMGFNGTGKVTTAIGTGVDDGFSVSLQSDGKIVVAGGAYNGTNTDFALVRYNTDGSRDPSFNGNGKVTTDFGGSTDCAYCVAIQNDGKILAVGSSGTGSNQKFAIARYNANGGLDTTFNGTGKVTTSINITGDSGSSVAVQSDGKIVVAGVSGSSPNSDFALMRYNSDGSLDTTFNGIGKVTATFFSYSGSAARSVAIQGDGNIVLAGFAYTSTFSTSIALARYKDGLPGAKIAVEQPVGTALVGGTSSVTFGGVITGSTASRTFTIKNIGGTNLTGLGITFDGMNSGDFAVTTSPISPLPAGGSTTVTVRFAPLTTGSKTAKLHISSNDSNGSPFDINLTGMGLDPNADDDGDGLTNAVEANLLAYGFDPLVNNSALLVFLRSNGLYQAGDMQTLALGSPLLAKDTATGHFHLSIGVEKSSNMSSWSSLTSFVATYDPQTGKIDIDITPDTSNPQFYRVIGAKP